MSYGNQTRPASRPAGFNPLLLIIVGVVVFWFLANNNRRPNAPGGDQGNGLPNQVQQFPNEESQTTAADGWQIDEMDAVQSRQSKSNDLGNSSSSNKSSQQGDWSISELGAKQQNGNKESTTPESKKTEQGDWAIEEVNRK